MPIPDFQDLMLPILKALSGGNEMSVSDIRSRVAAELGLTDQDLAEWLPSGSDLVFDSRAAVIRLYIKKAGLIEPVRRGVYKVTSQGLQLLASEPARIDLSTLKHYPSFRDYWNGVSAAGKEVSPSDQKPAEQENPREILEAAHRKLQAMLADELLATVRAMSPRRFEKLVLELLGLGPHEKGL